MSGFDAFREDHQQVPEALTDTAAAMITVDEAGMVTGWSPGARRLLGYRAGQVVGWPMADILAAGNGALSALRDEWCGELTLRHADDHLLTLPVRAYALSHRGESQWLLMVAGPKESLESQAGQAMMDWLFTDSPVALTIYDTELRCVWQNAAMSRMVNMSHHERRGRQLRDVLVSPDVVQWEERMRQVMENGVEAVVTIRGRTPADPDHDHVFSATASPLRRRAGQMLGVCATVHDITEQHLYRERLTILNEASAHIGSTLDLTRTAQELTNVAVPRLADFVSVDLLEPMLRGDEPGPVTAEAELRRIAHRSIREGAPEAVVELGEVDLYPRRSPPARCLAAGRPVLLRSMDAGIAQWFADDPARAERAEQYGFHSWLAVPIRARGVTLGVTVFCRSWPNEPFELDDLLLAEELVTRAAVCLDNARRFTREHTAALALQRSLLPQQIPRQLALEAAFRYLPASSQFGVGGDWFDVIPLSGARVALVVGDVVGHGIHASATMGRLRAAVRTLADVDLPPDELLTHLDDMVAHLDSGAASTGEALATDTWATCMYAVYNPVTQKCSLACAGHPPPAVRTPDGAIAFPDVAPGPPLGTGGLPFEISELELPDGSEIVFYTDGLIGSRDVDIDSGFDQLRSVLAKPATSPDMRCDAVLEALLPEHHADDVALLIARTHALNGDRVATTDVPVAPAAVASARTWANRQLAAWGLDGMGFVTELVVSELVTNAIRYGAPPIQLRLIRDAALICEVSDAGTSAPHLRRARDFDEGGRGLLLVAQLTQRWGTRNSREGKTIWCEQPIAVDQPKSV